MDHFLKSSDLPFLLVNFTLIQDKKKQILLGFRKNYFQFSQFTKLLFWILLRIKNIECMGIDFKCIEDAEFNDSYKKRVRIEEGPN